MLLKHSATELSLQTSRRWMLSVVPSAGPAASSSFPFLLRSRMVAMTAGSPVVGPRVGEQNPGGLFPLSCFGNTASKSFSRRLIPAVGSATGSTRRGDAARRGHGVEDRVRGPHVGLLGCCKHRP